MKCPTYHTLDRKGRINWLNNSKRCQWCLSPRRTVDQCPPVNTCYICGSGNHHISVCEQRWEWKTPPPATSSGNNTTSKTYSAMVATAAPTKPNNVSTVNCVQKENTTALLPPKNVCLGVAPVVITNPKSGASTQVYTFHDSGSNMSILRCSVADKLGLVRHKIHPEVQRFLDIERLADRKCVNLCSRTCGKRRASDL